MHALYLTPSTSIQLPPPPPRYPQLDAAITDKHEELMSRMGGIMAAGILDAGGRNVTVGTRSAGGHFRRTSLAGLALFTQYWFWYPLSYFLSLAFQPTALIALDGTLKPPVLTATCHAKPSVYAYP